MKKFLSCEDIAERYDIPISTVWKWIRNLKIPAIKMGREYRIKEEELEKFETKNLTFKGE